MRVVPTPDEFAAGVANAYDAFVGGGIADTRPMRSSVIDDGPKRAVHRYWPRPEAVHSPHGAPVLLVPPLAAPALCFDLRRGCSLVQYLLEAGRKVYLVDYGQIAFSNRNLGIEDWVEEILPKAIQAVSDDAEGEDVQLVGWCLGGIMSLLAIAEQPLPVRSLAMVASPFDFTQVPMVAPLRGHGYDAFFTDEAIDYIRFTHYWNWTGFPVAALPSGAGSGSGLPVGVSLIGGPGTEWLLLGLGIELQDVLGVPR